MQKPEGTHPEGDSMHEAGHEVSITYFHDEKVRNEYLRSLYVKTHESGEYDPRHPEVFRTPGAFLLEFATAALSWDQIVEFIKNHPDTLVCCMDERDLGLDGAEGVASHTGCGAAGLVAGLAKSDPEVRSRLDDVLGKEKLDAVLAEGVSSDELGKLWAQVLAGAANEPYRHLEIDHDHHYATMTIADAAGILEGDTSGEVGKRAFMVSNTEFMGNTDRSSAFDLLAKYTVLSVQIAWGDHSVIDKDQKYTVVVTVRDGDDAAEFRKAWLANVGELDRSKIQLHFVPEEVLAPKAE